MTIEPYNYNDEPSGRSETLVQALERCERLEKQLKIAVDALIEIEKHTKCFGNLSYSQMKCLATLKQIKELEK